MQDITIKYIYDGVIGQLRWTVLHDGMRYSCKDRDAMIRRVNLLTIGEGE